MLEYLNIEYNLFIISILSAFVLALAGGPIFIPLLRRLKFGQNVRSDGPQSHLKKTGTPAMGGLIFLLVTVIVCLVFSKDKDMLLVLASTLLFGLIGFADDYIKIVKKRILQSNNKGNFRKRTIILGYRLTLKMLYSLLCFCIPGIQHL